MRKNSSYSSIGKNTTKFVWFTWTEIKLFIRTFLTRLKILISGALTLICTLQWNSALNRIIEKEFGNHDTDYISTQLLTALAITAVVVVISMSISEFDHLIHINKNKIKDAETRIASSIRFLK